MEKYFKILEDIEAAKIDITKLYLLSSFKYSLDTEQEEWKAVNYCYDLWLNANIDLDLGKLADTVAYNWEEIKSGEISKDKVIDMVLNY